VDTDDVIDDEEIYHDKDNLENIDDNEDIEDKKDEDEDEDENKLEATEITADEEIDLNEIEKIKNESFLMTVPNYISREDILEILKSIILV